jgi:SEC-C motif-containing protein
VLRGAAADTAERLMRSRYTAFAGGDEAHLLATWHPSTRPVALALDAGRRWTGLEVLRATGSTVLEASAVVEFRAHSVLRGVPDVLHERSRFVREGGRWLYVGPVVSR